jgi:23S rRNA (adenine2503-C2)-methyltransferase
VADIMTAARAYQARTGRIVNLEYCMLAGVNDSDAQANELARLMEGFRAHVNLIPYNTIGAGLSGIAYQRPSAERMDRFMQILRDAKVVAHFRRTRGDDVSAACGQLRQQQSLTVVR